MSDKTFYVTTPIYYVNARPHIGHAYTTIVADVLARRHRLLGDDTFFLTGTDEHGQKIERSAAAAGVPPQQFADQVSKSFEDLWKRMGITNNDYIRTTSPKHKQGVQKLFSTLYERGFIYLASYTGSYCVSDEAFVDAPVGTPCPDCGRLLEEVTEENFFFKLSAFQKTLLDLIESNSLTITPDSRRNEVLSFLRGEVKIEFLKQGSKQDILRAHAANPTDDPAARAKLRTDIDAEIRKNWPHKSQSGEPYVPGALKDLSISRSSFTWGIPVPHYVQQAAGATQMHVVYVWLDALANYITALGYGSDNDSLYQKFWPADLHLVGKEIIRFHCVYWPAFLLAAGLPTPEAVTAHGWLLFEESKMSKSKGNIVRTETILDGFGEHVYAKQFPESSKQERDLFASDVLRYFLLREIPFGQDGSFSFEAMITRYNADLANGYGNLVSRTLNMIYKYRDGIVTSRFSSDGLVVLTRNLSDLQSSYSSSIRNCEFARALELTQELIRTADIYVSAQSPWRLAKADTGRDAEIISQVLYVAAETIRIATALLHPMMPCATAKVWAQLGLGDIEAAARDGELNNLQWGGLKPGTKLGALGPIFPRADKGLAQIMTDMENPTPVDTNPTDPAAVPPPTTDPAAPPRTSSLHEPITTLPVGGSTALTTGPDSTHPAPAPVVTTASESAPVEAAPAITIDDFVKVELRVAEIKLAERIPKADKLLRLEVDLGALGQRQILSGIAEWYAPEDLVGRRIIVITNLAPRKMRGLESHGMLLAASEEGGKPFLATVPEGVPVGTRLK